MRWRAKSRWPSRGSGRSPPEAAPRAAPATPGPGSPSPFPRRRCPRSRPRRPFEKRSTDSGAVEAPRCWPFARRPRLRRCLHQPYTARDSGAPPARDLRRPGPLGQKHDVGNSSIRQSCARTRSHARCLNPLARGCLSIAGCEFSPATAARADALQSKADPFPVRLQCRRQPSYQRRNTAFVRQGPRLQRHAPADLATVHSLSPSPANARGAPAGSIPTVTTRDTHHHHVPCPWTTYNRALARHQPPLGLRAVPAT